MDVGSIVGSFTERLSSSSPGDDWNVVDDLVDEILLPFIGRDGTESLLSALSDRKVESYVGSALVSLSGRISGDTGDTFRITDVYADDEIVDAAIQYLCGPNGRDLANGHWGWTALWNGWGQFRREDHLPAVLKLVANVPWVDEVLWMIGDGPLGMATGDRKSRELVEKLERTDDKLMRIRQLLDSDETDAGPAPY